MLSVPPIDEPSAIPAGPKRRISSQERIAETISEEAAMITGVRVSRNA